MDRSSDRPETNATSDATVIEGQKRALELALHGASLETVLAAIVETIEAQSVAGVLGSILLLDEAAGRLRHGAAPSLPAPYSAAIDGIQIGPAVGSCGTAAFTGETVVVREIASDPLWAAFKELALAHGLRACWSTPIRSSRGGVLGTFALYHRTPTTPSARDQEIVGLLGDTAALVIERDQQARRQAAADEALRRARDQQAQRLGTLFHHAPVAIAVLGGDQHVFEVTNPRYDELVGARPLLGKPVREAFPDLEGQVFFDLLDGVYRTKEPFVGRSQRIMLARGPGGALEEAFVDFVYQPIPGADGAVDSILAIAFEVTELAKAKAAAEASERGLKTFIDNLPELAWTARPDGHVDFYNQRWYEYTGTTFDEMQRAGWDRLHDPEVLPTVNERWRRSLATGEAFEMEFTLRGADGASRWFLTRVVPMRDASGAIVRWFGTNTNIHEIKAAGALAAEVAEQSRETQRMLLDLRAEKERAEQRVAELEAERLPRP